MKLKTILATLLTLFIMTGGALAEGKWYTDWESAAKASKASKKPILINFTGSDWCGWCIRLKDEVFNTKEFKTWTDKNVVLLEIDFPRGKELPAAAVKKNEALAQKYGVEGFPTIIFADHSGKTLGRYGYDEGGPKVWTKKAQEMLK